MAGRRRVSRLLGLREILRGACPAWPERSCGEQSEGLRMTMLRFRMETHYTNC
jgi:hypothetical protein